MYTKPTCFSPAIIILFFCCLLSTVTNGQTKKTFKKIYVQAGAGFTSRNGGAGEIGIQSVFQSNWTLSLSYNTISADPKNLPSDYEPDYILFIPFYPTVDINLFTITGGKLFPTGKNTWFTTEAGVSFGSGEKMTFTPVDPQFFIIGATSNYDDKTEKKSLVGLMLKTDFNWAFSSFMGLGTGVYANLNSVQSPVGGNIKLLIGKMDKVKRNK